MCMMGTAVGANIDSVSLSRQREPAEQQAETSDELLTRTQ